MKTINKALWIGAIAGSSLVPKVANAQGSFNVEGIVSFEKNNSYVRPNLFYGLPSGVKGFTFLEMYTKDEEGNSQGYFGKTTLTKNFLEDKKINPQIKTQIKHADSPFTSASPGIGAGFSALDGKLTGSVDVYPLWFDKAFSKLKNEVIGGYFISLDLPKGFNVNSFGQFNLANKEGPTWAYGEVSANKNLGKKWNLGYNPALKSKGFGKFAPRVEHRITLKRNF
jgi:hypothetical protein